ncbi:MAG TPA: metalloregulator ArsR/SmtB family transcription factor [Candidatus Acidoferrales bacterium]|nr:metalloregulator ArsR/SmtB family transcription factor [Candidatus Acidoferrales bacterium]
MKRRVAKKDVDPELFFRALADPTRLRLINLLAPGEVCVCFLVEILGASQPKISRHLAYLRRAGIAGARRQGRWMHYRLLVPENALAANAFRSILVWLASNDAMKRDRARLMNICRSPALPAALQKAPKPSPAAA